jgi:hypothetical protein
MATAPIANHGAYDAMPRRSYISLRPYYNDIKSYATSYSNDINVGTFSPVSDATLANCLQGAILHETGKKLYAGVQPGVSTYMVSVFDYANSVTGFIDPNGTAFTPQNTDRPYTIASPGSNTQDPTADRAPPVYTRGNIFGNSNLDISGSGHIYSTLRVDYSTIVRGGENIYGAAQFYSNVYVPNFQTSISTINVSTGKLFENATSPYGAVGVANMATASTAGTFHKLYVSSFAVSNNSIVLLTHKGSNSPFGYLSAEEVNGPLSGQFRIVSNNTGDNNSVQWMVIN